MSSPYAELGLHDYKYISNLQVSSGVFIILARLGILFISLGLCSVYFFSSILLPEGKQILPLLTGATKQWPLQTAEVHQEWLNILLFEEIL